jgi:glycosyltransferase involved in cell wall biosynthesis
MIARNEAHVIQRCFESLAGVVDCIYLADTGSEDETIRVALQVADQLGILIIFERHEWVNFGHNRTQAMRWAEETFLKLEWHLIVDADDVVAGSLPPREALIGCDGWRLRVNHAGYSYERPHLLRADGKWRYRGPIHEFAERAGACKMGSLDSLTYEVVGGGARSRDHDKFKRDAEDILRFLVSLRPEDEDLRPRLQYYLGQSYKDAGMKTEAIEAFRQRMILEGYAQERYMAAVHCAWMTHRYQRAAWAQYAFEEDQDRPEAPYLIASGFAEAEQYLNAFPWAHYAATRSETMPHALFYDPRTIEWARNLEIEIRGKL